MRPIKILVIFGTRPEAIKLAPLIKQLEQTPDFAVTVCVTAQHREMLDQVLSLFEIVPDFDLNLMQQGQSLTDLTAQILTRLEPVFTATQPDLVLVHGDTTTAFVAALAAFYRQIPVAHIEAGLRTHQPLSPFPEEANRRLLAVLAQWHFAPTEQAKQHLIAEGIAAEKVWVVGNTVIDALYQALRKIRHYPPLAEQLAATYPFLDGQRKQILVTCHRRENQGQAVARICRALNQLAQRDDVQIIYSLHPNPQIRQAVENQLKPHKNLFLLEPQPYLGFIYLMDSADLILTDSGGIQEEATALGKPVLLLRESSERPEAIETGTVKLIGTQTEHIISEVERLLTDKSAHSAMAQAQTPYGNGSSAEQIISVLSAQFKPHY